MSSISRITAALASATNDVTLAAANINFDFSLMKVEVPTEFQPIGTSLSDKRRMDAEIGTPHRTARILGALFEDVIPSTPQLVKAYGSRVSEIIRDVEEKTPSGIGNSLFKGYVGADGTSIWAAATSGTSALHVQLLTCVLARLWSGPEATSVWTEIVKERKKEIASRYESGEPVHYKILAAAAQPDLSRSQLADWDASARAWLRTADVSKLREQKQLMLILDNIDLPVNTDMKVYSSVIKAWKTALTSVEALLSGTPQSLQGGALILALSAWHLYPDLIVLGDKVQEVQMRDPLIPSAATITIGLRRAGAGDQQGIHWSLSLAHLRYYGRPVKSDRSYNRNSSRITFEELVSVAFGCLLNRWKKMGDDVRTSAEWFLALKDAMIRDTQSQQVESLGGSTTPKYSAAILGSPSWLRLLMDAACSLLESSGSEVTTLSRLMSLGSRQGHNFLGPLVGSPPDNLFVSHENLSVDLCSGEEYFGLCNPSVLLPLMKSPEARIKYLRHLAVKYNLPTETTFIRYMDTERFSHDGAMTFEYASARPQARSNATPKHYRWLRLKSTRDGVIILPQTETDTAEPIEIAPIGIAPIDIDPSDIDPFDIDPIDIDPIAIGTKRKYRFQQQGDTYSSGIETETENHDVHIVGDDNTNPEMSSREGPHGAPPCFCSGSKCGLKCVCVAEGSSCLSSCSCVSHGRDCGNSQPSLDNAMRNLLAQGEVAFVQQDYQFRYPPTKEGGFQTRKIISIGTSTQASGLLSNPENHISVFRVKFGDPALAAIFVPSHHGLQDQALKDEHHQFDKSMRYFHTQEDLKWALNSDLLDVDALLVRLSRGFDNSSRSTCDSLRSLATAAGVYKLLPGATVSIEVVSRPIKDCQWVSVSRPRPPKLGDLFNPTPLHQNLYGLFPFKLSRANAFACVTYFESGHFNIPPSRLKAVMAMSSGDSIFVAAQLICDPYQDPQESELRRILGNVGRAGINLLIPPQAPMIAEVNLGDWNVINHTEFDGKPEDNFEGTSLHLSFTEYNPPVSIDNLGSQDEEVFLLEAVISVHQGQEWIGDVDILSMFSRRTFGRLATDPSCSHQGSGVPKDDRFVAIDNWKEFIDPPERKRVVRAHKNWVARLAAAAFSSHLSDPQGHYTVICPEDVCWDCCSSYEMEQATYIW